MRWDMRNAAVVMLLVGCWGTRASPPANPPAQEPAAPAGPPIAMVTSAVMMDACPEAAKLNSKQASKEIAELVSPCTKVPGGAAHFSATLLPGGRVELGSPSGDPGDGVVPTCLIQNKAQLKHRLKLQSACRFDVKLEEHTTAP